MYIEKRTSDIWYQFTFGHPKIRIKKKVKS